MELELRFVAVTVAVWLSVSTRPVWLRVSILVLEVKDDVTGHVMDADCGPFKPSITETVLPGVMP